MFGKTNSVIRTRIMEVIEENIREADMIYENECADLEEGYSDAVQALISSLVRSKEKVADDLVAGIIKKA